MTSLGAINLAASLLISNVPCFSAMLFCRSLKQPSGFFETCGNVEILNRLPTGALDQVIQRCHDDVICAIGLGRVGRRNADGDAVGIAGVAQGASCPAGSKWIKGSPA